MICDPWFAKLAERAGPEAAVAAGWFEEQIPADELERLAGDVSMTSFDHLRFDCASDVVLLTSGSFDPFHSGHRQMLEVAADTARAGGLHVAGGWVVPDHDRYAFSKRRDAGTAERRCAQVAAELADCGWLAVDGWGSLVVPADANFTTLLRRARRLLDELGQSQAELWYVCGSDNAVFAPVFEFADDRIRLCVVPRGGHEQRGLRSTGRLVVAGVETVELSSTLVRARERVDA